MHPSRPIDPRALVIISRQAVEEGNSIGRTNAYFTKLRPEDVDTMATIRAHEAWSRVQRSYPELHKLWTSNKPTFLRVYSGAFSGAFAAQGGVIVTRLETPVKPRKTRAQKQLRPGAVGYKRMARSLAAA